MPRPLRIRQLVYSIGAVGGTVALFSTVLDRWFGDQECRQRLKLLQLSAESLKETACSYPRWNYNWDHRDIEHGSQESASNEENGVKKSGKASRHIILIRHGQYNLEGKSDDQRYLTELGREQARLTGLRLEELALPYTVMIHSNMTRAVETANIIRASLATVPLLPADGLLAEGPPIVPEPMVVSWRPEYQYEQEGARIEAAFRKYFHRAAPEQTKDSYEIIVCHANVIRYFVCRALQFPPEAWLRLSLHHASLTHLVIRPDGRVHLRNLGEAGHFPVNMLTTS